MPLGSEKNKSITNNLKIYIMSKVAAKVVAPVANPSFPSGNLVASRLSRRSVFTSKKGNLIGNYERIDADEADMQKILMIKEETVSALHASNPSANILINDKGKSAKIGDDAFFNEEVLVEVKNGQLVLA